MTAGELIARVDGLRPNQYAAQEKLRWLRRLDGQILRELSETHEGGEEGSLPESYTASSPLLAPFPYAEELYSAYLMCQIDLHNAEIGKYNQSMLLLSAAWRQFADWLNRSRRPKSAGDWRL